MATMEKLQKDGYLVMASDTFMVYAYNKDKYLCDISTNGKTNITVISNFYR